MNILTYTPETFFFCITYRVRYSYLFSLISIPIILDILSYNYILGYLALLEALPLFFHILTYTLGYSYALIRGYLYLTHGYTWYLRMYIYSWISCPILTNILT